MKAKDMRARDMRARDMRARDMRARDMRARDMRARDMRARDMRARDMRARDTRRRRGRHRGAGQDPGGKLRPPARTTRGPGPDPGLPGPAGRAVRRDRVGGDGRARRRRGIPAILRGAAPLAEARRPAADPADVPRRPRARFDTERTWYG